MKYVIALLLTQVQVPVLKKVVVASGNKIAIGDNLQEAISRLVSQEASRIEIENTDDEQGLIEAIIKTNNNLEQSNQNNDWELMGKDITKLQTLIKQLEALIEEKEKTQIDNEEDSNTETRTENTINTVENTI